MRVEGKRMNEESKKDLFFILYILVILILAVIYFSVPERALFIENAVKWWKDLLLNFRP